MKSYKFSVGIDLVGCKREETVTVEDIGYSEEDWDAMTYKEREKEFEEQWKEFIWNHIDGNWEEI